MDKRGNKWCEFCLCNGCIQKQWKMTLWSGTCKKKDKHMTPKVIQLCLYQQKIKKIYGTLGCRQRKQSLWCIKDFIKDLYPDEEYVGFCERVVVKF